MSRAGARCLLAGAGGYIGRHLVAALRAEGCDVVEAMRTASRDERRVWDICDPKQIPGDLDQFDTLFWMAGVSGTTVSFERAPDFIHANVTSMAHVLNVLRGLAKPPRLVFPSTRLVYKGLSGQGLTESSPVEPLTPYAATKWMGENLLQMYGRQYGVPYTIVRLCVLYGNTCPGPGSYGTLRHFLEPAQAGRPITIFGDGAQRRSLIHVADLGHLLGQCGLHPGTRDGLFNLGGPDNLSVREIADKIAAVYGVPVVTVPWPEEALKLESGDTVFDDAKLAAVMPLKFSERFDGYVGRLR